MCGITGYFGQGNQDILSSMTDALYHRGPDDKGFYCEGKIGLGHRRLSIIDLSAIGRQPMANEDDSIHLAFNGEIYNYQDLKKQLKGQHHFKSQTDTEVIIHLYEEIGTEVFSRLGGMFAIALYDSKKNQFILARDRLGKKPLYWGKFGQTFMFASELKSFLKHPDFKKELNLEALDKYLTYEYVPTPHSIFKGVYKLESGTYLVYDGQKVVKEKFWDVSFKSSNLSFTEAKLELDRKLDQATKARLMSDVPLGIFLSGGIDSSTIAYYAQKNSQQKIKTFSIGFKEASFDESSYARQVAKHLGTEHYEQILSAEDSLEFIPKVADLLDEPMADASIIPTYLLSKFTKEKVTVALGGDGGDELFCGYDTFLAEKIGGWYNAWPWKKPVTKLASILPTSFNNISFDFKIKKFLSGFDYPKNYRHQIWLGSFDNLQKQKLFSQDIRQSLSSANTFEDIDNYLNNFPDNNYYNQLIYLYLKTYLMDDILVKVDRASMFNSLEVRAPFLDWHLVDFVNSLPLDYKLHGAKTKYILKQVMADKLPPEIVNRKKKGFGIPMAEWLTKQVRPLMLELLSKDRIERDNLFDYNYIKDLTNDHLSKKKDNRKLLWTLMVFQMWQNKWLK